MHLKSCILKLKSGQGEYAGADPEDKDEYKAENVFFVPEIARWSYLQSKAKLPTIGKEVDNAMDAIEKDNSSLRRMCCQKYMPAGILTRRILAV